MTTSLVNICNILNAQRYYGLLVDSWGCSFLLMQAGFHIRAGYIGVRKAPKFSFLIDTHCSRIQFWCENLWVPLSMTSVARGPRTEEVFFYKKLNCKNYSLVLDISQTR